MTTAVDAHSQPVPPTPVYTAPTPEPHGAMERINALEARVALVEKALRAVHGVRWMDELKGGDEPTGE